MIGTQVGSYRIDQKLGEGGMGTVYRGTELNLERTVAIKVLNKELTGKPVIVERFRAEAKAQANLNHPNVATLYAFLQEDGEALMVMEFVDGENLQQMVNRRGAIPSAEAIPLFKQALAGIGAAHEMGLVHRDIKPANIMLNQRGNVKVMDFGIAKVIGDRGLTRTGVQLGTVFYMSPEQVKGQPADVRSDIYALGVTLYELLTAHVPFNGASEFDVLTDHVHAAPPLPSTHNANIPKGIENVVLKALEKKPDDRFQTVSEFSDALDHPEAWESYIPKSVMIDPTGRTTTMEIHAGIATSATQNFPRHEPQLTLPPPAPARTWTPLRLVLAVLVFVAIACAVTFGFLKKSSPPATPPPAMATITPADPLPAEPAPAPAPAATATLPPPTPQAEPQHFVIPVKTELHVQLPAAIEASVANESELFPVVFQSPIVIDGKTVAPAGSEAKILLKKAGGSKKSPKVQFQLDSIKVGGKSYKVRSDTFEFNGSTHGKHPGKFSAIGNAVGAVVGGKHNDAAIELPAETEMVFTLKSPVPVTVR